MKKRGLLIVVSGPSGAGKGTICKGLLGCRDDVFVSVSATTRSPRNGEEDGVNYFFLEKEEFVEEIANDGFIEYAKVYDNYYGTPSKYVLDMIGKGNNVLLEIDIQGALQIKNKYPEGVFVFIFPPSMNELKDRLIKRGSETEESFKKRFGAAIEEMGYVKDYDYYIVNDDLDEAVELMNSIVTAERVKVIGNIEELLKDFKEEQNVISASEWISQKDRN